MSESLLMAVADDVTLGLNQGTYSLAVTALRLYQPKFELKEMDSLHVSVVPRSILEKRVSRKLVAFDCGIDIGVQQRVGNDAAQLDGLSALVTELSDRLRTLTLPSYPGARLVELSNDPVYAPDHLSQLQQFTSVIRATFRVWK